MNPRRIAAAFALLWVIYALPEVSQHGIAIDSPSLFYAGDRTFFWLTHPGHPEALDFTWPPRAALPGFQSAFFPFPDGNDPFHYPVFAGLVASAVSTFTGPMGVSPIDGHHLGLVLLHAIGLYWFTLLALRVLGRRAGVIAAVSLLLFPEAVGQAFNNAKDWPCVDFYACALLAAIEAFVVRRPGAATAAGVLSGLALSCKLNGAFALACIGLLALYAAVKRTRETGKLDTSAARDLLIVSGWAFGLFILLWPYLYVGPGSFVGHVRSYLDWYISYGKSPRDSWTSYPFRSLFFTTPPLVLLAAAFGVVAGLRTGGERRVITAFIFGCVALPILRTAVPHSNFYDGNRHFMEYIPGLCLLAGIGGEDLVAWLQKRTHEQLPKLQRFLPMTLGGIYVLSLAAVVLQYRPFEATYFNSLIGGLGGAQSKALYNVPSPHDVRVRGTEGDYWYGNIGDGVPRLAALVAENQGVYSCGPAPQQIQMTWPAWREHLRPNAQPGDLIYVSPREVFCGLGPIRSMEQTRPVLYRAERGGGLVYEILGPQDGQPHPQVTAPSAYEADRTNWGSFR